jgi:hypothetical protein
VQCTEVGVEGLITQLDDEITSRQRSFEDRHVVHKELGEVQFDISIAQFSDLNRSTISD